MNIQHSINISFDNVTQVNGTDTGIGDMRYYGVMASNFSKNLSFNNCYFNRIDAHQGFWNVSITNSTIGHTINAIGGGNLYIDNVTKITGSSFLNLRTDYGGTFNGDITIKNCKHQAYKTYYSYRGGSLSSRYSTSYIINTGYSNNNEAYWKWNFGYERHMPRSITFVEDFTTDANKLFVYYYDYETYYTEFVPLQSDDYSVYKLTEEILYKNWKKEQIPICNSSNYENSYMYKNIKVRVVSNFS